MRFLMTFMSLWLASSVAFSNGSTAPELELVSRAKSSAEYPVLKRIQDLTLELQLLEITLKNRRDGQLEEGIASAVSDIESKGQKLGDSFRVIRAEQLDALFLLLVQARRFSKFAGVAEAEWNELYDSLRSGTVTAGTLVVHGKKGTLGVLSLSPLHAGKQMVWQVSIPSLDRRNFWVQARTQAAKAHAHGRSAISDAALAKAVARINAPAADAEARAKAYFNGSYSSLYRAFERHRYAILQRVQLARNALAELGKSNAAMGAPEEYAQLYNQLIDNLASYGVDVSLAGNERDFAVKGFLFADTPEAASALVKKLKFSPSAGSYNSPSS
jgi:hypothetical protein